ncbi:High affinity choline transporter 1 [Nibea albiflora]|uniref:High affinity choline transporter 1 n=1 Tax=Nibea albiflora TaxID=240163 RepID=A0ACB7FEN4_NIBAL|nr:High affinity choline transporter 1 [Nibea albiflora]
MLQTLSEWLWWDHLWLPANVSWSDLKDSEGRVYAKASQLYAVLPCALCMLLVRYLFESYLASPLADVCGVKNRIRITAQPNSILENYFCSQTRVPSQADVRSLCKKTSWPERKVQVWFRRRRNQDRPALRKRFCEASWRCVFYFFAFVYGVLALHDKPWLYNLKEVWKGFPKQSMLPSQQWYYLLEMGFYLSLLFSLTFDVKRKDFREQVIHHIATLTLLSFSWISNYIRIGTLVMLLHDSTDILLEGAKVLNYAKWHRTANVMFAVFTILFMLTRLVIFPFWLIHCTWVYPLEDFAPFFGYYFFNVMLSVLQVLHLYWAVLISRMFYKCIFSKDAKKEYLEKKERGELAAQKVDFLKQNILRPVNLTMTSDGRLHFGDVVMLVNVGGENRQCSAVSINADINSLTKGPSPGIQAPCGVTAGRAVQACTRTAFIITSVDGSPEGSTLLFEQSFALKTTSGFARGLYLASDVQSFQKCAKKSRLQEVNLEDDSSFLSWWKIVHFDPQERLEYEGQPVPTIMAVNVPGLVAVVIFYIIILLMGIWASRKSKKVEKTFVGSKSEVAIVGGRNISVLVGVFTMTATWVGGGYIMGTAEAVYSPSQGLIWAMGPPAYLINFLLGGLFFAKPMRSKRYVTMLDPFQHRYGNIFTATLLLPALVSDILWVACILAALGGTMSIILGLSSALSIVISAAVSIIYTFLGGLYSVAYTDIIQLSFIFVSLFLCIPFLILSPAVTDISEAVHLNQSNVNAWIGELELADAGKWMDEMLLLALGGLAYQALYQRILSAASSAQAQVTCFAAAGTVFIMGIPSVVVGVVAASTDWNKTAYGLPPPFERGEAGKILPLALHYLTPTWLSVLGIGSVAAAVMSSMDSVLLSSASMFTQNIYKTTLRKQASERELQRVIRVSVLLVGLAGMGLAFGDDSVFALWMLSGDLIYCVILPQLVCVLHFGCANTYGAISGYVVGIVLRGLSGEPVLGIPPLLLYPGWREENGVIRQYFPYRTLSMVCSVICVITVSKMVELGFCYQQIPQSWDLLGVFDDKKEAEEEEEEEEEVVPVPLEKNDNVLNTKF